MAALKGALLSEHPAAVIADISHSVPAYDLQTASFLIWAGVRSFPAGSVHLAVVDPGVGTDRRAIAFELGGSYFVGPDNGLFSMAIEEARPLPVRGVVLGRPAGASRTFEGRDVFAPAAGRLAAGEDLTRLGPGAGELTTLPTLPPRVLWVDAWGNLITSLRPPVAGVRIRGHEITASAVTFGAAPKDQLFHYVGSLGLVEVAVREGRADRLLDVVAGERVSPLS